MYINGRKLSSAKDQIDQLFTKVLNENRKLSELVLDLSSQKKIWLVKDLTETELAKFELYKNSLIDIGIETQLKRYLPHKNLFSHVVGQIDEDNNGISGLEKSFDQKLRKFIKNKSQIFLIKIFPQSRCRYYFIDSFYRIFGKLFFK